MNRLLGGIFNNLFETIDYMNILNFYRKISRKGIYYKIRKFSYNSEQGKTHTNRRTNTIQSYFYTSTVFNTIVSGIGPIKTEGLK